MRSKEQGFLASYYEATVVSNMGDNYVVEYKELLEDDEFTPLNETVMVSEVRPRPPSTPQTVAKQKFTFGEVVDAYDNDGWWVGIVTRKRGCYCTFFSESTWDHMLLIQSLAWWNKIRIFHMNWRKLSWMKSLFSQKHNKVNKIVRSNVADWKKISRSQKLFVLENHRPYF